MTRGEFLPPDGIRQVLSSANVAAILLDSGLRIRWFTSEFSDRCGFELWHVGQPLPSFFPRADAPEFGSVLQQVAATRQPRETSFVGQSGIHYLCRVSPFDDGEDGTLVTLVDVESIRGGVGPVPQELGDPLQTVLAASPTGVLTLDEKGRVVDLNPAAERLLGYSRDEIRGRSAAGISLGGGSDWTFANAIQRFVRGDPWPPLDKPRSVKGKHRDGSSFYCELVGTRVEKKGQRRVVFLLTDISRSVRAEREAAARRRLFEATVGNAAVGISVCSMFNEWLFVNDRFCDMLGYPRESLVHLSPEQLTHPDDVEAVAAEFEQMVRRGTSSFQMQKRYLRSDGTSLWALITVSLQKDRHGQPLRSITVTQDISEVKQLEYELRESIREREQFLVMLSHELRNPLSAMLNASQLLGNPGGSDPRQMHDASEVIRNNARSMGAMLEELLDVSRFSSSKVRLQREDLDFSGLVHDAVESVRHLFDARKQTLDLVLPVTPLPVNGDAGRLQQAVVNLLVNANKYTPENGFVRCLVERQAGQLCMTVSDSGAGIPQELLERIFEPFYQVQQTIDRSLGGMGLGLSLVRMILRLHGGEVIASSEGPGRGSRFFVTLPLCQSESPIRSNSELQSIAGGCRLVLVDDHPGIRMMLGQTLQLRGFTVEVAANGQSALELIQRFLPDVMLVDIGLPDLNGYELARIIRRNPAWNPVRLIAMTGYGQESDRIKSFEAGFGLHLVKPLDADDILRAISDIMPHAAIAGGAAVGVSPDGSDQPKQTAAV